MTKILEFPKPYLIPQPDREISSQNRDPRVKPEDDREFRIPYRDPPKGLGDDIVWNSRIPKDKSRIP